MSTISTTTLEKTQTRPFEREDLPLPTQKSTPQISTKKSMYAALNYGLELS